ncbi:MAG: SsrA-binding protein SmpB [Candidatus Paceibacterota bacterium]
MKIISENRKAEFDYEILDRFEAGLVLNGQEVKSIKTNGASLNGTYVMLRQEKRARRPELFWLGANVPPYQPGNIMSNYDTQRARKLLLNRKEINYLIGKTKVKGLTLVALRLYDNNAKLKLEFGIGRGRKKFNKKELIKTRDAEREIRRALAR